MKSYKTLRNIEASIIEKDVEKNRDLQEAERLLKVAAYMGPYAFTITSLPLYVRYEVDYKLIPDEIKEDVALAMETIHKNVEARYKEVSTRYAAIKKEMMANPNDRWVAEKFNAVNQLKAFLEVALPSLKQNKAK